MLPWFIKVAASDREHLLHMTENNLLEKERGEQGTGVLIDILNFPHRGLSVGIQYYILCPSAFSLATGVLRENSYVHWKNIQTTYRKTIKHIKFLL